MYIPRPAKLLFQHDDGWERFLDKNGHQLSDWTKLSVERMLACGTCAIGVRRYCCSSPDCTHSRFLCQSCKSNVARLRRERRCCAASGVCMTGAPLYTLQPCISPAPPNSSSPSMTAGTATSKNTATASASGPVSPLSACSPVAPAPWASAANAAPRRTAHTPVSSARAASQRPAAPAA
ncbi:transposase zinc-binding domain-containing protein [Erwinia tracheiphila]|uniref:Transposase zinc-binding domain-containing protein n=1 Tax=Erwinia tracheiphila TaxID=65700 RepID=A0A345CT08_9GAMM|nr:transposase zinc-binding domain-containing protein [Erwinia tracheiphila]AXF76575.1 hypothetical protein AV903_11815 [Erwinia tracheiphila]UIA84757.1 transposase zinc-binding domain-containing protein [Erwinia tracheiphila]